MDATGPLLPGGFDPGASALVADLSGRGELVLTGNERAVLLHRLLTNDIQRLSPGQGCHAALLTAKGKMVADMNVLVAEAEVVLDCDPSLPGPLLEALQKYAMFSDVALADRTAERGVVHLEGPAAATLLAAAGVGLPAAEPHSHVVATVGAILVRVVSETRAGLQGFDLRTSRDEAPGVLEALVRVGAVAIPPDVLEAGRIEAGLPRWGRELDETVLPDEAGLNRSAISYTKGCYIGQETVARIKTYGHVNRCLVALHLGPTARVEPGAVLRSGEEKAGKVTSAARSSRLGRTVALGYVKRDFAGAGTELTAHSGEFTEAATVVPLAS